MGWNILNTEHFVRITPLHLVSEGESGTTYDFTIRLSDDFIVMKRHAGTLSGNAYHTGLSHKINPKTFILLQGSIELLYRHIDEQVHHSEIIDEPSIIEVYPNVTHAMKAITDIIVLEAHGAIVKCCV
jgi:hypothetical protein